MRKYKSKTVAADPKGVDSGPHFMDGDHALAEGALAAGCRFFAGYPITPSTETFERFAERAPEVGAMFIQMEDELSAIAANIGAVWGGQKVMTVTCGPGFSLMVENIGLAAMTETPMVICNVQRAGPSTGAPTLTAQQDMMQARYGPHGDNAMIALSPDSPQECFDLAIEAFNLSEYYRVPVIILADETVGHMHEKVVIPPAEQIQVVPRNNYSGPKENFRPYKFDGQGGHPMARAGDGYHFHITGLTHNERGYPVVTAEQNKIVVTHLMEKINGNADDIVRLEENDIDGADVVVVSYGITSRIAVIKAFVVPELNYGQMVLEVERCAGGKCKVISVNHCGGAVHDPEVILDAIRKGNK